MSNLRLKKINDESVNEVPHMGKKDSRPIKGSRLFDEIYANILLVARKKSGKTSCIFKIIQECCTKDTTIVAFVSTLHKDASWQSIQEYCDTKDIPFIGHTSITDEEGHNQLADLVKHLQAKVEVPEEDPEDKQRVVLFNEKDETKPKKERKSKFRSPEYLFIFADLSDELKNTSLLSLLKKNRHFKSKIIISTQYLNDRLPQSRKQIDYTLIFKGQPQKKLDEIYRDCDVGISPEEFYDLYSFATEEPFSFLYIDRLNDTFRRNFNYELKIN